MPEPWEPAKKRWETPRESPERVPWLRYDRMARAVTERLRVRPVRGEPFWVLAVRNPVHHTHYRVFLPDHPSEEARFCSCVDFSRRGIGTCKHVEAATAWLETHPEVPRPPAPRLAGASIWRAIDAVRRASKSSARPAAVRWREPGKVLFEKRGSPRFKEIKMRVGGRGSVEPVGGLGP
jgi:hypothetical protein